MEKVYIYRPGAGAYGPRIYLSAEHVDLCREISNLCLWGGHDKSMWHTDPEKHPFFGFEFRETVSEARLLLERNGFRETTQDEMIRIFEEYRVR